MLKASPDYEKISIVRDEEVARIERDTKEDVTSLIANEKYGFIAGALAETFKHKKEHDDAKTTRIIDSFVTSKLFRCV